MTTSKLFVAAIALATPAFAQSQSQEPAAYEASARTATVIWRARRRAPAWLTCLLRNHRAPRWSARPRAN